MKFHSNSLSFKPQHFSAFCDFEQHELHALNCLSFICVHSIIHKCSFNMLWWHSSQWQINRRSVKTVRHSLKFVWSINNSTKLKHNRWESIWILAQKLGYSRYIQTTVTFRLFLLRHAKLSHFRHFLTRLGMTLPFRVFTPYMFF